MSFRVPEKYRVLAYSSPEDGNNGLFFIPGRTPRDMMKVIASDGMGWEHVSVSKQYECPTWDEMCKVKGLFWDHPEDWAGPVSPAAEPIREQPPLLPAPLASDRHWRDAIPSRHSGGCEGGQFMKPMFIVCQSVLHGVPQFIAENSTKSECHSCIQYIWVSPSTVNLQKTQPQACLICEECAAQMSRGRPLQFLPQNQEQLSEIEAMERALRR